MKTDKTERFAMVLDPAESLSYRHFLQLRWS